MTRGSRGASPPRAPKKKIRFEWRCFSDCAAHQHTPVAATGSFHEANMRAISTGQGVQESVRKLPAKQRSPEGGVSLSLDLPQGFRESLHAPGQYTGLEPDTHNHRDYSSYSEYVEVETPDKSHHIFASTHQPSRAPPPLAHPPLRPLETSRTRQPSPHQPSPPPKMDVKLNAAHFRDAAPHVTPQGVHNVLYDTLPPAMRSTVVASETSDSHQSPHRPPPSHASMHAENWEAQCTADETLSVAAGRLSELEHAVKDKEYYVQQLESQADLQHQGRLEAERRLEAQHVRLLCGSAQHPPLHHPGLHLHLQHLPQASPAPKLDVDAIGAARNAHEANADADMCLQTSPRQGGTPAPMYGPQADLEWVTESCESAHHVQPRTAESEIVSEEIREPACRSHSSVGLFCREDVVLGYPRVFVTRTMPGSSSAASGRIKPGDLLAVVDGEL